MMSIGLPVETQPPVLKKASSLLEERRSVLVARDLNVVYPKADMPALRGVSVSVAQGFMTMVLGRSGSGKTTLLKTLAGLIKPRRGCVQFLSRRGNNGNGHSLQCGRIAYIPQHLGLVRSFTALENTLIGSLRSIGTLRSLTGFFPRSILKKAEEILGGLGLSEKSNRPVSQLSGGERQRVAIARALMLNPEIILADEFVSLLDPVTTQQILDSMRALAQGGVAFLIATHDTDVVLNYADRVIVMDSGHVRFDGSVSSLTPQSLVELLR